MWRQIPLFSILLHINKWFPAPSLQARCSDCVSAAALELWSWRHTSPLLKTTTIPQKCDHICWWYSTVFFCISLMVFSSDTLQQHMLFSCPAVVKDRLTWELSCSKMRDPPYFFVPCLVFFPCTDKKIVSVSISDAGMSSAVSSVIYKRLAP